MASASRFPILLPLAVSAGAVFCTVIVHALATTSIVHLVRREGRLGIAGIRFWCDVLIVAYVVLVLFGAHLLEIAGWGGLLELCREAPQFSVAFYHSAGNFTTLGYGGSSISPRWGLLGPMEAANGMLMFGTSTAIIFAVIQRLIQTRLGAVNWLESNRAFPESVTASVSNTSRRPSAEDEEAEVCTTHRRHRQ